VGVTARALPVGRSPATASRRSAHPSKGNHLRIFTPPAARSAHPCEAHDLKNRRRQPMNPLALAAHDLQNGAFLKRCRSGVSSGLEVQCNQSPQHVCEPLRI
jgi:hypothetical protein